MPGNDETPKSGIRGVHWSCNGPNAKMFWRVMYKDKDYGKFPTVEEAAEYLDRVKAAIAAGEPVPENPYKGKCVKAKSGEKWIRYKTKKGTPLRRPWFVVYNEKSYGSFPTKEEAVEFRDKLIQALENGEPAPENPYFRKKTGTDQHATGRASESGLYGVHKLTLKNGAIRYRANYQRKSYGQYRTQEEAEKRLETVIECINNGLEIPPGPAEIKHLNALKRANEAAEQRAAKKEKRAAQARDAAAKKAQRKKAREQTTQEYNDMILQMRAPERDRVEMERREKIRHTATPQPVPPEQRPKFKCRTQAERDQSACASCFWASTHMIGENGSLSSTGCLYGITPGNRTRLAMHYERTGAQDPRTLTHGEACTEWTPKKGKRYTHFTETDTY